VKTPVAGLVPAIHVLKRPRCVKKGVGARHKAGHGGVSTV
jgi:hypothetical protein